MRNLFLEKNIVQKLIIAVVVILLFNFSAPTIANAESFIGKTVSKIGGELLPPIMKLFVTLGDGILGALQTNLMDDVPVVIKAEAEELEDKDEFKDKLLGAFKIVAIGVGFAAVCHFTGGAAAGALASKVPKIASFVLKAGKGIKTIGRMGTIATGVIAGGKVVNAIADFTGEYDIVQLEYTPFAIFSNRVPMFDINFFNPKTIDSKITPIQDQLKLQQEKVIIDDQLEELDLLNYNFEWSDPQDLNRLLNRGAAIADWSLRIMFPLLPEVGPLDSTIDNGIDYTMLKDYDLSRADTPEGKENIEIIGRWIENGLIAMDYENSISSDFQESNIKETIKHCKGWKEIFIGLCWACYLCDSTGSVISGDAKSGIDGTEINKINSTLYDSEIFYVGSVNMYSHSLSDSISYGLVKNDSGNTLGGSLERYGYDNFKKEIITVYNNMISMVYENKDQEAAEQEQAEIAAGAKDYANDTPAKILQKTIAKWYEDLRNLALVILLIILVYIGIRIVLSSTAPEKAKYKQMIINWVVAIVILFLLHLIMVATLAITETITEGLSGNCVDSVIVPLPPLTNEIDGEDVEFNETDENGESIPFTLNTNFVGYIRFLIGINYARNGAALTCIGYMVMYIMLVVQTCMFTWVYGKRVVYMAFLTIIAPLVAITYPIDKIGDGKSQAFDMWIKEYIFNALLQPIHLLIYTVVCGTAMDLMVSAPIYGIIALGFVVPAEKFIRKMFGFEKAQTPSALGGAAGAALAMTGIQKIGNLIRPDGSDDRDADRKSKLERIRQANLDEGKEHDNNVASGREKALHAETGTVRQANTAGGDTQNNNANAPATPVSANEVEESEDNSAGETPVATSGTAGDTGTVPLPANTAGTNAVPDDNTDDATPEINTSGTSGDNGSANTQQNNNNIDLGQAAIDQANEQAKKNISSDKEKKINRFKRAAGRMLDMDRTRLANAFTHKKNVRRVRKAGRKITGVAFGAGTALTMAAMKMALGANAGDVANTALAGGAAGYAIGSKATQKAQEFVKLDEHIQEAKSGYYTAEQNIKRMNERGMKEFRNNAENRALFREAGDMGGYNGIELLNSDFTEQCLKFGLQEPEEILAAHDYMNSEDFQETYGLSVEEGGNLTEQERKSLAIETIKDSKIRGDIRHDQKKLDEMKLWRRELFSPTATQLAQQQQDLQKANRTAAEKNYNRAQEAYNAKVREAEEQASETSTNVADKELYNANKNIEDARRALDRERERQQRREQDQINKNEEAKMRIAQLKEDIAKQANEYDANQETFSKHLSEAEAKDPQIKRLREEKAKIETEIQEAQVRGAAQSEIDKIMAQKNDIEKQYKRRNSALADEENALRKVESELEAKRRNVRSLQKAPTKISEQEKADNQAKIAELEAAIEQRKSEKQSLLQGRFNKEYEVVKATKKAVSDSKVDNMEDLKKTILDTMVDQSMKGYYDARAHLDKFPS